MAESSGGKPADFFIGLVDFFSILLPGAMLTFCIYKCIEHRRPGALEQLPRLPEGWASITAFVVVAYLLGHLLFVIGALCLDPTYDWWKESFRVIRGWKAGEALLESWADREKLNKEAEGKSSEFGKIAKDFHRLIRLVRLRSSEAAAEMDHLEADHKFFRSLILVFLFAWPFLLWSYYRQDGLNPFLGLLLLLLLPMFPFKMFRSVVRSWLVGQAGWLSKILIIPIGLTLILVTWQCWTFVRSLDKSPWLQVVMLLPLGALGLGFAVWWHQYKFFKNRRGLRLSVSDDSAYLKDQLARGQLCVLILLLAGSVVWLLGTALSENNPPAQAQTAPEKNDKALAGGQTTMPLSSISVTAVSGTMSVTATTEHKYSNTNATPPPRIWVAASLCFGIALSFVRFFQQRLRYTKVAYRTFLVIADAPSEGGEQKPKGRDTV